MIGYAQVPVGVVGPVVVRGDAEGRYAVPLATTEGAFVAGTQRGAKLAEAAGGVLVRVLAEGMAVYPTVAFDSLDLALGAARWVRDHREALVAAADATTKHGKVQELRSEVLGRRLVLSLRMQVKDAHGINLVTRAAEAILAEIPGGGQRLVHGYDVEKRASTRHWRGRWTVAELVVPESHLVEHLGVRAAPLAEMWTTYHLAYGRMGTPNHALQIANGLAALYIATGQDVAYVAESAVGTLSLEDRGGRLHATLDLPNLHAATVGGGTQKGTARECQAIIGAPGARELACVFAATLLCGEVSLAAAMCAGQLGEAHEKLGRNRPG